MRVFLVRHAQSEANRDARLSSADPGPPLTLLGHAQAAAAGRWLRAAGVRAVHSSPLLRARQTAQAVADAIGTDVQRHGDLREFDLGGWEGRPGTDLDVVQHPVFSSWLRGQRLADRFEDGESALDLRARLLRVLSDLGEADTRQALVSHGGLMAVAIPLITDGTPLRALPPNGTIVELVRAADGWAQARPGEFETPDPADPIR